MKLLKNILRARIRTKLKAQRLASRRNRSIKITGKLFECECFKKAARVAFFVSLPEEVDTRRMIDRALRAGKFVAVPKCDLKKGRINFYDIKSRKELKKGILGIPEPKGDPARRRIGSRFDCVVVPGIAFDKKFNRLGRGGGFYDRFLRTTGKRTFKVGIGYAFQLVPKVPTDSHDTRLDLVITD